MKRYAIVKNARTRREVEAYLPENFEVIAQSGARFLIEGTDVRGWGLDTYVIPRLASGLIFADEISADGLETWNQS